MPLQQPLHAHHALRAFPVDLATERAAGQDGILVPSVGFARATWTINWSTGSVTGPLTGWPAPRHPVEAGPVDLHHARHDCRPSTLGPLLAWVAWVALYPEFAVVHSTVVDHRLTGYPPLGLLVQTHEISWRYLTNDRARARVGCLLLSPTDTSTLTASAE
jgi:hypothetical protein